MIRKVGGVQTAWGTEVVWTSTNEYCSKLLMFNNNGDKTAIQFAKTRHMSWFVNEGQFMVRWIDTLTGSTVEQVLKQGDVLEVPPLRPYQLEALLPNSVIFESGTAETEGDICFLSPVGTAETQSSAPQ